MSPGLNDKSKMSVKEVHGDLKYSGHSFSNGADGAEEIKTLLCVVSLSRFLCS